ncbi:hypothetical protein HYX10_01270 [Candidatus Woesearchaeota archaeon]|nr:hypothetical protein [Candidatus Woesearchaeota archaeon]
MVSALAFTLVSILSMAQFFSDRISVEGSKYREYFRSFAAAIAITYLLFSFLPEAYTRSAGLELFAPIITGFLLIHMLEKIFYKEFSGRFSLKRVKTYHDELHAAILFTYHIVIGIVLVRLLETNLIKGLLFLPPLLMFTTTGNWSLQHEYLKKTPHRRFLLASATLFGALLSSSALITLTVERLLVNFAAGILLFIVIREALPREKEGRPEMFAVGIAVYAAIIFFLSSLY